MIIIAFNMFWTVALNYQNTKSHPERVSNLKPFVDQYDWKQIDFPSQQKTWKKFELNNKRIEKNIYAIEYWKNKTFIQIKT